MSDEEEDVLLNLRREYELPRAGERWIPPSCYVDEDGKAKKVGNKIAMELPSDGSIETPYSFYELPLTEATLSGLRQYTTMTKIQCLTIPHILQGRDVIAEAATGAGKTLCFVIPILEAMARDGWEKMDGCYALILTPTRELSMQIFDVISTFKAHSNISCMAVFGGKHVDAEASRIGNIGIVIGTPGRVLNHLDETYEFNVSNCRMVVLDEADKLIELGFLDTTEKILEALPDKSARHNLFFSATLKQASRILAKKFCREDCERISEAFEGVATKAQNLHHSYIQLKAAKDKMNYLYALLSENFKKKIIVFCSTIKQVRLIYETFHRIKTGARIIEIHGSQDQNTRLSVFDEFNRRKAAITIITTDLLGRGVDFPDVDLVIHLDCPADVATYTHRSGRTARGVGHHGQSILLLTTSEMKFISRLKEKGVQVENDVKVRVKTDITPKLRGLCAQHGDIKHLATKAFQSYIKSYSLLKDKQVFNLQALLSGRSGLAGSFGLVSAPPLPTGVSADYNDDDDDDKKEQVEDGANDDDEHTVLDGGVDKTLHNEKAKNLSKLERLKLKIAAKKAAKAASKTQTEQDEEADSENDEGKNEPKISRREKRRQKLQQLRNLGAEELMKDVEESFEVTEATPDFSGMETINETNWRENEQVKKALRAKRLVIRADGTAKLKGAAKLIPVKHTYYGSEDEDEGVDAGTFEGVLKSMASEQKDEPILSRSEWHEQLRKRLTSEEEKRKEEKEERRKRRRQRRKRHPDGDDDDSTAAEERAGDDEEVDEEELAQQLGAQFGF